MCQLQACLRDVLGMCILVIRHANEELSSKSKHSWCLACIHWQWQVNDLQHYIEKHVRKLVTSNKKEHAFTFLNEVSPHGLFGSSGSPAMISWPPGSHCIRTCKHNVFKNTLLLTLNRHNTLPLHKNGDLIESLMSWPWQLSIGQVSASQYLNNHISWVLLQMQAHCWCPLLVLDQCCWNIFDMLSMILKIKQRMLKASRPFLRSISAAVLTMLQCRWQWF